MMFKAAVRHVRRRPVAFVALAVGGLISAAVAAPVLAQSGGSAQTITFSELNKGSRFAYIDNPPRNTNHHRRPVFSVGDEFVLANPLADASGKIGELRATCTLTKRALAPKGNSINPAHPFCTGAFVTTKGTLFIETTDSGAKVTEGAVVGGTGAYIGARGIFSSTPTRTGNNDVVILEP